MTITTGGKMRLTWSTRQPVFSARPFTQTGRPHPVPLPDAILLRIALGLAVRPPPLPRAQGSPLPLPSVRVQEGDCIGFTCKSNLNSVRIRQLTFASLLESIYLYVP